MDGGHYAYQVDFLVSALCEKALGLRDEDGDEVGSFPASVYSVNDDLLGVALNKQGVIDLWNANSDNQNIGTLSGHYGPFTFLLRYNCENQAPDFIGVGGFNPGVDESDWIDADNTTILDFDDSTISIE